MTENCFDITKIKEVREDSDLRQINYYLKQGWKLLFAGTKHTKESEGNKCISFYIVGRENIEE